MNRLLALLPVLATVQAAGSTSRCPDVKKNPFGEITPCAACTVNNFEDGQPLCGYCYSTGTCEEVTASSLLSGVCASANTTAGKYDYSLNTDGACDCRVASRADAPVTGLRSTLVAR